MLVVNLNFKNNQIENMDRFQIQFYSVILFGMILVFFKDTINGSSIGKKIMNLKIINSGNPEKKVTATSLILRNLFLIIWPVEFFILMSNKNNERLGDKVAKTRVVISSKN